MEKLFKNASPDLIRFVKWFRLQPQDKAKELAKKTVYMNFWYGNGRRLVKYINNGRLETKFIYRYDGE